MDYATELPRNLNKCPIHKTWATTMRPAGSSTKVRWCEQCRMQLDRERARQDKAVGAPVKPKLKIITI